MLKSLILAAAALCIAIPAVHAQGDNYKNFQAFTGYQTTNFRSTADANNTHVQHVLIDPVGNNGTLLVSSTALEASHVLTTSSNSTLITLNGYNSGAAQYILLLDGTAATNSTVPKMVLAVSGSSNFSLSGHLSGFPFTTGITVSNSSTAGTLTVGSTNCFFSAVIR